jgi:VWFA-related protein
MKTTMVAAVLIAAAGALPLDSAQQVFRAAADATGVHVTVRNGNKPVPGLTAADFELLDNTVPQQISAVTSGSVPIDITLVLDTSGSVSGPALRQLHADLVGIARLLGAEDRVRLLTFASTVKEEFSMRPIAATPSSVPIAAAGATAFHHALVTALLPASEPGRPHLVVAMSDGQDNVSLVDSRDVLELARRSDDVLYVVLRKLSSGYGSGRGFLPFSGPGDPKVLKDAAAVTGGRVIERLARTPPAGDSAQAATWKPDTVVVEEFKQILDEFRGAYVLWFKPSGVMLPGWHELTVRVKKGRPTVTHRKGYFGG